MSGIIESLGVEIEFSQVSQKEMLELIHRYKVPANISHDASCESTQLSLGDIHIPNLNDPYIRSFARQKQFGGEIITDVLSSERDNDKWFEPLATSLNYLRDMGEKPSLVTGIHVHLQCGAARYGMPLSVLKSLVLLWRKIEAAIYRITEGEMGYSRGQKHLGYCYYRPLVPKDGPVVIKDHRGNFRSAFDIDKLLNAKTTEEFFISLCRDDMCTGRYWASKYHALNLHSINSKGTVEFRTANLTLNPKYLYTWIRIFQQILALSFTSYLSGIDIGDRQDLPLGYNNDDFDYLDLVHILDIHDENIIATLEELWKITSWAEPVKGYQRSHLGTNIGIRMTETIVNYSKIDPRLVPDRINPERDKIYLPEELINPGVRMGNVNDIHIPDAVDDIIREMPNREPQQVGGPVFNNQRIEWAVGNVRLPGRRDR